MDQKANLIAGVVMPHEITQPIVGPLPASDTISVKVLAVRDENPEIGSKYSHNWEIECEYPDGFIAHHQVAKMANDPGPFLDKIRNKLRGRHGSPHGNDVVENEHGLSHIAGELIGDMPEMITLTGKTLTFKKVG